MATRESNGATHKLDANSIEGKLNALGFVTCDFLEYGDYDNSCAVERANVKVLFEDSHYAQTFERVWCDKIRLGIYGSDRVWSEYKPDAETTMIVVEYNYSGVNVFIKNDEHADDILRRLQDYPCLDDEAVTEIEHELEMEAWSNWIESDIGRALSKLSEETGEKWQAMESSDCMDLYQKAKERGNEYGHVEAGGSWWIDLDKLTVAIASYLV